MAASPSARGWGVECQYYESECVSQGGKDFSFGAAMMGKIARL